MSLDISFKCDHCGMGDDDYFNITHNLNKMADKAGIYNVLWRPEEIGVLYAKDMVPILEEGLSKLKSNPEKFKKYNPENGWGSYDGLISFSERVLKFCIEHPNMKVSAYR